LLPGGVNPRDLDGDGFDDDTGEPVPVTEGEGAEAGEDQAANEGGEMTVEACLALRPDLVPVVTAAAGEAGLASFRSLRVSAVPPPFAAMVPAECR
jgi:hypothetical protein